MGRELGARERTTSQPDPELTRRLSLLPSLAALGCFYLQSERVSHGLLQMLKGTSLGSPVSVRGPQTGRCELTLRSRPSPLQCQERVVADTNLLLLSDGNPVCSNCSYQVRHRFRTTSARWKNYSREVEGGGLTPDTLGTPVLCVQEAYHGRGHHDRYVPLIYFLSRRSSLSEQDQMIADV